MQASSSEDLKSLEHSIRYTFRDRKLLKEAITHRSFYHENPGKARQYNERIEFLGDAVLGLVMAETLFREHEASDESRMSKIKSYLVSGEMLSRIATRLDLGRFLHLGRGEELSGGRNKISILANTLEALIGAIFLDSHYEAARDVILFLYKDLLEKALSDKIYYDFKSELQELSQVRYGRLPQYILIDETGDDHDKTFTYVVMLDGVEYGKGSGKNKKTAQSNAASVALENIRR